VVVAISINLTRILAVAQLPRRAGESLILLVGAIVLTSLALVPNQPEMMIGVEMAAVGLITLATPLAIQISSRKLDAHISRVKRSARVATTVAGAAPFLIAGVLLCQGSSAGLYWAAAGVIVSLVGGVWNTWILLVEILR